MQEGEIKSQRGEGRLLAIETIHPLYGRGGELLVQEDRLP